MPIAVTCTCGKSFRAKDELAGKKVRCPSCSGVLTIALPAVPPPSAAPRRNAEDESLAVLMSDAPVREEKPIRRATVDSSLPALSVNASPQAYGFAQIPETNVRSSPPPFSGAATSSASKPKKPAKPRADLYSTSSSRGFFADANWGGALVGLLMMLGGAAWLGLGLLAGRIFFYSVILIILGFVGMVKSVLGFSSDD